MKRTSQIGVVVAGGLLLAAGVAGAADATKPSYSGYQSRSTAPNATDYHSSSNSNDYHANYHADYSATQDGRPGQAPQAETPDPRDDARRFQDGDRYSRYPFGYRR
jgi:hypothetical protein